MSSALRAFSAGPFLSLFPSLGHQALWPTHGHLWPAVASCGLAVILIPLPHLVRSPPPFYLLDKALL